MRQIIKLGLFALVLAASLMSKEASAQGLSTTVTGAGSASANSWVAGLVFGYNWQRGPMVFGVETDFQGMNLHNTINPTLVYVPGPTGSTDFATASSTIDRYGTLRGRIGTTFGSVLLYVTGGLAYGLVDLNSTFQAFGLSTTASNTQTRVGGVVGAGAEYLIKPNWMLTFQYQYVDLGRVSVASSASGLGPTLISQSATPRAVWNPDIASPIEYRDHWLTVPDAMVYDNAFKVQWELYLKHLAENTPFPHDLTAGARGVQLAEIATDSWHKRCWVTVP